MEPALKSLIMRVGSLLLILVRPEHVFLFRSGGASKMDEFLKKFQTAFDPALSFLENHVAIFYNGYKASKIGGTIYGCIYYMQVVMRAR